THQVLRAVSTQDLEVTADLGQLHLSSTRAGVGDGERVGHAATQLQVGGDGSGVDLHEAGAEAEVGTDDAVSWDIHALRLAFVTAGGRLEVVATGQRGEDP